MNSVDTAKGDVYEIVDPQNPGAYDFVGVAKGGAIVLRSQDTKEILKISRDEFDYLRGEGIAIRTVKEGVAIGDGVLSPHFFLSPDDRRLSERERTCRRARQKTLTEGRTLQFGVKLADSLGFVDTKNDRKIQGFLDQHAQRFIDYGFAWLPSASALKRAFLKGKAGFRPLSLFVNDRRKHKPTRHWPDWVIDIKNQMIEVHWSLKHSPSKDPAIRFFETKFYEERARRGEDIECPVESTLHDWINKSVTKARYAKKYNIRDAHKLFEGVSPGLKPVRPLEYVIVDQTLVDLFLVIVNAEGEVIDIVQAWLVFAMDLYSRMVLGAYMSLEPPSVHSLMRVIRDVIRPKQRWIKRFGTYKGATDGWGKPVVLIFDNAKENIGISASTVLEGAGIHVEYAPIHTPEWKAWIERLFRTMNELWHTLPGGIPYRIEERRRTRVDFSKNAIHTLEEANFMLDQRIVTCYHVEKHDGIGMAPARKWAEGLAKHKRYTVDNPEMFCRLIGKVERVRLTNAGIILDGQRFHDQVMVTRLIGDMLPKAPKRYQGKRGQAARIWVNAFFDPLDCSSINVVNEETGELVKIPNIDEEDVHGMSFAVSKQIRLFAERKQLGYHSRQERAEARWAFFEHMEDRLLGLDKKEKKRAARDYQSEKAALIPGTHVEEDMAHPNPSGMDGYSNPTFSPITQRRDHGVAPAGYAPARKVKSAAPKRVAPLLGVPDTDARNEASTEDLAGVYHVPTQAARDAVLDELAADEQDPASFLQSLASQTSMRF
jgi:hypothetical protein